MGSKSKGIQKAQKELQRQIKLYRAGGPRANPRPMFDAGDRLRSFGLRSQARRAKFTALYNANPCNFLPGSALRKLYKLDVNQRQLETLAGQAILHINEIRLPEDQIKWPVV